jgi:hypothetical protein
VSAGCCGDDAMMSSLSFGYVETGSGGRNRLDRLHFDLY